MKERDFLLLDGDCGLCHRLATFMDKRLARGQDIGYRPILSEEGQEMIATLPKKQQDAGLPNQKWKIIHSLSSRNPLFTLHEMVLQNVVPNFLDYSSPNPRALVTELSQNTVISSSNAPQSAFSESTNN